MVGTPLSNLVRMGVAQKGDEGYRLVDRGYALWLRASKSAESPVLPPLLIGTASEERVAQHLREWGFSLVYQSKASRGVFDLLAVRDATQLGIQVKRCPGLPFYLAAAEKEKMVSGAKQLGWLPLLGLDVDGDLRFYALSSLRATKTRFAVDGDTPTIGNLLELAVPPPARER